MSSALACEQAVMHDEMHDHAVVHGTDKQMLS